VRLPQRLHRVVLSRGVESAIRPSFDGVRNSGVTFNMEIEKAKAMKFDLTGGRVSSSS
jgi:hypothetical protein